MKKTIMISLVALILMPISMGYKIGDINHDGSVDIADVVYLFKHRNIPLDEGDVNCDNSIDIADVVYLFKNYDEMRKPVVFAETFQLEPHWDEGYCIVVDSKGNKFVLLKEGASNPNIPNAKVINIPVQKLVTIFYSPFISTADILNDTSCYDTIKGAPLYAIKNSPTLYKYYEDGKCVDIGKSSSIDYEKVTAIDPNIVFLGDWSAHDEMEEKLKELGITTSRFYTYKEPTFMGRIEWIKFAAAFWGEDKYNKTEDYFQKTWKARNNILRKVYGVQNYPTVVDFSWSKYKNLPGIYGAQHYYNKMVNNFGGEYIFNDIPGTSFQYLDKETFYERAMNADVCILRWFYGDVKTKEDLLAINPDFANFKAFKNGRFYVSHPDYYVWETKDPIGYMMDFAKMIHPELFGGDDDLKYYYKIK
ncbi:ABC transporter substrate-binding protein [Methanotorris formicicus]|uniref:Periplasmic binding protein n=1 Tax=Methanotorris formicicus Mc-S-70 TaxID=647171 RepID=H1KYM2_9EURY|nr:ABC transporter substrate-binding protein [Methanotorris formicicus]EHP86926.1 periplasmic binding protein [Methanotorris formicicus Mc-S-70]